MKRFSFVLLPILLIAIMVGCSNEDSGLVSIEVPFPDNIEVEEMDDVADDFSAMLADPEDGLIYTWSEDQINMDGGMLLPDMIKNERVTLDTVIRGDMTIIRNRVFYDVDGNESEAYDSSSTVGVIRFFSIEGTRENERGDFARSVTIDHESSVDVNGISPEDTIRTHNGTGTRETSGTMSGGLRDVTRNFDVSHEWSSNDVQMHKFRHANPYPLSGTVDVSSVIHREMTRGDSTRIVDIDVAFTVEFDGTRWALVTMEDGTEYLIDLRERRAHRRQGNDRR